jgi:hypothetical protein
MERWAVLPTHRLARPKASIAWLVVICTIGAVLLAVMVAAQDASAQDGPDPVAGWFQRCALTKTGAFDPIVNPGKPKPVGHRHLFFGSTAISPTSTTVSALQSGSSTCLFEAGTKGATAFPKFGAKGGNFSSYWVPDLLVRNGSRVGDKPLEVNATQLGAYYRKGASSIDLQKVNPFPSGLRMVIRDRNTSKTNVQWYCSSTNGKGNNGIFRERPYDCDTSTPYKSVTARITSAIWSMRAITAALRITRVCSRGCSSTRSTVHRSVPIPSWPSTLQAKTRHTQTRRRAFTQTTSRRGSLAHGNFSWITAYTPG